MVPSGLNSFRESFPIVNDYVYFDVATRAPLGLPVSNRINDFIVDCQKTGGNKEGWLQAVERLRAKFAALIGGQKQEVALTKNTSEGLNIVAAGLDWQPGDNVLIAVDLEHPNNVYPWLNLRQRGVQVKKVETPKGMIEIEEILKVIDERTRVISLSLVTFITGAIADLKILKDICRQRSILLVVDAVQGLGVIPLDVEAMGIDVLATSTHKRLLGLYGLGFFYCREELFKTITPLYVARKSIDYPDPREFILGDLDFRLAPSASRFEIGNFNYLGVCAAEIGIDMLAKVGVEQIHQSVSLLARQLREALVDLGFTLAAPTESLEKESGIISFRTADVDRTYRELCRHRIKCSVRRGWIRFSLHGYNNQDDLERVLFVLKDGC